MSLSSNRFCPETRIHIFNQICQYAIEQNAAAIKLLLIETGFSINLKLDGMFSPVAVLIKENQMEAAAFLMKEFDRDMSLLPDFVLGTACLGMTTKQLITKLIEIDEFGYGTLENITPFHPINVAIGNAYHEACSTEENDGNKDNSSNEPREDESINHPASILGYIIAGKSDIAERICDEAKSSESLSYLVMGYALLSHIDKVKENFVLTEKTRLSLWTEDDEFNLYWSNQQPNEMIDAETIDRNLQNERNEKISEKLIEIKQVALYEFSLCGNIEAVNEFIRIYDLPFDVAIAGYQEAGYLSNQEELLWLLDFTENSDLRKKLIEAAETKSAEIKKLNLLKKEEKIISLMAEYGFSHRQAVAFLNTETLVMLLEINPLMITKGNLPLEIIALCTSKVTNLTDPETIDFIEKYYKLPPKLHEIRKKKIEQEFSFSKNQGMFSSTPTKYDEEMKQADLAYQKRMYRCVRSLL